MDGLISESGQFQFENARQAVAWAVDEARVVLQRSSLYRRSGQTEGLAGYEAAGHAGMIVSRVRELREPRTSLIVSDASKTKLTCECRRPCCSGYRFNPLWTDATASIAEWWVRTQEPHCARPRLVLACVRRYCGEHIGMEAIAKRNAVGRTSAVEMNGRVVKPLKELKEAAWRELESVLAASGIVATT